MSSGRPRHLLIVLAAVLVVAASAALARYAWDRAALAATTAAGASRLELVAQNLRDTIGREAHFPLVMARDPDVRAALRDPRDEAAVSLLNDKLAEFARAAGPAALYVMQTDGLTIAASNWADPNGFVGHNYRFRSYFTEAMETGAGSYFGIGVTSGRAGYFLSRAVSGPEILGVAVAKVEFYDLEASWARGAEHILVTEANDIVFLSNRPEWKYRALGPIGDSAAAYIETTRQYDGAVLAPLSIEPRGEDGTHVGVEGLDPAATFLRQSVPLPELGWTVHQLTDLSAVADARRDGTVIGGTGSALLIAVLFFLAQRQQRSAAERRVRGELERRVAERTRELRDANASLKSEIEERRRTEIELRTTQNDLVQAGKLAALGQMSAAIAHEINQPLTAMRTYVATTRIFVPLGDDRAVLENLDMVDSLAVRMARITSHLKTFARKGGLEPPEPISVSRAVRRALDLIAAQARTAGVEIVETVESRAWTLGNDIRLEQVVLNLVRNAMDAVAETPEPRIEIRIVEADGRVRIAVADNGPGFAPAVLETLFDPFVTTKPSGAGLGLGLTISAEIVRDFGGVIRAGNRPEGGAELVVDLPACAPAEQSPEPAYA